jgi:hypothetical protein
MTKEIRKTTKDEKEVLEYLNVLRNSGVTNMFGAAPYVQAEFGVDKKESHRLLSLWMDNFNEKGEYSTVKE